MKILYIMSSYNLYGGTPKKTLDLMRHFKEKSCLYVYHNSYAEFKPQFDATKGNIYEGFYGRNIFLHVKELLSIIDKEKITIIQTQFSMGETFGFFLKMFRPHVKLIVAFVTPFKPSFIKSLLVSIYYKSVDYFVYITKYVETEKQKQFSILKRKNGKIIFNGTERRIDNGARTIDMKKHALFDIAGLSKWKNIQVLVDALDIIVNKNKREDIYLYIAGDGDMRPNLEDLIITYNLQKYVFLLGYQTNVGKLLNNCDVFVHPAYAEGFGIVIPEAMLAEKPIIVSNAGALPELLVNEESGLVVEPHNAEQWSNAIIRVVDNPKFGKNLGSNAKKRAKNNFTKEIYTRNYENLYKKLITSINE